MRCAGRLPLAALLAAALACAVPLASLGAQAVRVRLADSLTAEPIVGALVAILERDSVAAEGVSSSAGVYLAPLARGGRYVVRVRRIGYTPYLSRAFEVAAGDTLDLALRVESQRVRLPTVAVSGRRQCERDPSDGVRLATIWEEIGKALVASELAVRDSLVVLEVRGFERLVDSAGELRSQSSRPVVTARGRPFGAGRPAAEFARRGYVTGSESGGRYYYAPDAPVLLSPEFTGTHCFDLVAGAGETSGMLGITFAPAPDRSVPDVEGTLWVDARTAELRHLDFRFVRVRFPVADASAGGRIAFERLPTGEWIVREWLLRMPRFVRGFGGRWIHWGFVETGGTARLLSVAGVAAGAVTGRIAGTVFDSITMRPLAGALVSLRDTTPPVLADSAGRFVLERVPAHDHVVYAEHPALDSMGLGELALPVRVAAERTAEVPLAVPGFSTMRGRVCAASDTGAAIVYGRVRSAAAGDPVPDAKARFVWVGIAPDSVGKPDWHELSFEVDTDSTGMYYACGLPAGVAMTLRARAPALRSGALELAIGERRVLRFDLALGDSATAANAAGTAVIAGVVRDASGRPQAGARVAVDGGTEMLTGADGRFLLDSLLGGTRLVSVRALGFAPAERQVDLLPGDTARLTIDVTPVVTLADVRIAGTRERSALLADIERRRKLGSGYYLDEADVARRTSIRSMLDGYPSVRTAGPSLFNFVVLMPARKIGGADCRADIYVDGRPVTIQELVTYGPAEFSRVEVYPRVSTAPQEYVRLREGCGVVLMWTKAALGTGR